MEMIPPGELEATVAARRELGPEREAELVSSFLDRIERGLDKRIDERLATQRGRGRHGYDIRVPLGSMGLGIGATAVATGMGGAGIAVAIVAWVAIALVNLAYALWR